MTDVILLSGAALALFIGLLLWMLILADRTRRQQLARLNRGAAQPVAQTGKPSKSKPTRARKGGALTRLEAAIAGTSLRVTAMEILVQVGIGVLAIYSFLILFTEMHPLLAVVLGLGLPVGLAALVLKIARARYRRAFTEALPETLDVFARGLRAGRPIADSLGIVVETASGPICTEFARCRAEILLGTALSESLTRLEGRLGTPEVSFFAVATTLQAETGGNLIETMENLADQLRERRKLRRKAKALSSEARASAAILAALPFAVGGAIAALNWSYLAPLFFDPRGQVMGAIAVGGVALGVFVMARMGKLNV